MHGTLALKNEALRLGFTTCGIAAAAPAQTWEFYRDWLDAGFGDGMPYLREHLDLKRSPEAILPGARSVIAVTLNYHQPVKRSAGQPKIAQYALGRDYHKVIRGKLRSLGRWVETEYPGSETRSCVDSAPILEREYAHRAGLGWFGKNTLLIDSRRGSWFFIGLLLTTAEFQPDATAEGGCGTCRRCIDACPTGAIVQRDGRWQIDGRRCISYLTIEHRGEFSAEQADAIGEWTFGCDVCQEVCPFNQPRETQPMRAQTTDCADFREHREWPTLVEIATMSEQEWDVRSQGSAMRRAGHSGLVRNAAANRRNAKR